jgi:fibronectin-binding autotransporter adhesin
MICILRSLLAVRQRWQANNWLEIVADFCCDRRVTRLYRVICVVSCLTAAHSFGGSATWSADPVSGDWNTAANWVPATVPNGPTDIASFSSSQITNLALSSPTTVAESLYDANAGGFTISSAGLASLTFAGDGIINSSAIAQTFVVDVDNGGSGGLVSFTNSAAISGPVNFTLKGQNVSGNSRLATVEFHDNSSAGTGSFICEPGQVEFAGQGQIDFRDSATAGTGRFICEGAVADDSVGGEVFFRDTSAAGNGIFTIDGTSFRSFGGLLYFMESATADHGTFTINGGNYLGGAVTFAHMTDAGDATFILNGSDSDSGYGGRLNFYGHSTPGNSTIIINTGSGGAGAECLFTGSETTGTATVKVFGNGTLVGNGELLIELRSDETVSIGSIEGNGYLGLASGTLMIGTNNRSTQFDGTILNGGPLTKVGTGILTLTGANACYGTITILGGGLKVNNRTGSGTGTGPVNVSGGTLSGKGIISGLVTVGSGSGAGGVIAPSQGASNPTTLTLQNQLIFQPDGSYVFRLNTRKATADQLVASGVTINSGAQFNFKAIANKKLIAGEVFAAISNTSATPISGTFANLADGSTVTVGRNKYQVSYSGGDGNDLTLTVVQ